MTEVYDRNGLVLRVGDSVSDGKSAGRVTSIGEPDGEFDGSQVRMSGSVRVEYDYTHLVSWPLAYGGDSWYSPDLMVLP